MQFNFGYWSSGLSHLFRICCWRLVKHCSMEYNKRLSIEYHHHCLLLHQLHHQQHHHHHHHHYFHHHHWWLHDGHQMTDQCSCRDSFVNLLLISIRVQSAFACKRIFLGIKQCPVMMLVLVTAHHSLFTYFLENKLQVPTRRLWMEMQTKIEFHSNISTIGLPIICVIHQI